VAKVEIYTTASCPYCERAKQLLQHKGAQYEEIRVDTDGAKLTEMLERSEGRRSVPQIFINGKGIGGFNQLQVLEREGHLDALLSK